MNEPHTTPARSLPVAVWIVGIVLLNNLAWYVATILPQSASERRVASGRRLAEEYFASREKRGPNQPSPDPENALDYSKPFVMNVPGISHPTPCLPDDVALRDGAQVIGVVVRDEPRAYVVDAFGVSFFQKPEDCAVHLVNDLVGGKEIWVTHCDRTRATRVLTVQPGADSSIDLRVGGWSQGMLLLIGERRFAQHDPKIPLADLAYTITSWRDWLRQHPNTLVYTGKTCGNQDDSQSVVN